MSAVIIGGATGIGRAAARKLFSQGRNVAIFDNNQQDLNALEETLTKKQASKAKLLTFVGDVQSQESLQKFQQLVHKEFESISHLFILAGIGLKTSFTDPQQIRSIFDVNFFGVVNAVSAFYQPLVDQNTATELVIAGSKQGITNPPGNPGYNASKAAVKSYAEGLSYDLRQTPISVRLLVPGWTFTKLTGDNGTRTKPAGAWEPEQVFDYYTKSVAENSSAFYIICPDNEVNEATDSIRVEWSIKDITEKRPALSRWRPEYQEQFKEFEASSKK